MHITLSALSRFHGDCLCLEQHHRLVAHALLQRRFHPGEDATVRRVERCTSLFDGDARLESRKEINPVRTAILECGASRLDYLAHADRYEYGGAHAQRGAAKAPWGDPDNGKRLAIDDDALSDRIAIAAKPLQPELVAKHGDEVRPNNGVIGGPQQSPHFRFETKHREVRARYKYPLARAGLVLYREIGAKSEMRGDAGKGGLLLLEVLEHRVAEHLITATGLTAILGARLGAWVRQVDQLIRIENRQWLQQDLVEQ